eukprot:8205033-Pyramimonas_sp.AAC.1
MCDGPCGPGHHSRSGVRRGDLRGSLSPGHGRSSRRGRSRRKGVRGNCEHTLARGAFPQPELV